MKKKTYVLTVAKAFMAGHPKKGQPTGFKNKILSGEKIHTLRDGDYWETVVREVNTGLAVLSVREWTGKPYYSKQREITQFERLGWQPVQIKGFNILLNGKSERFSQRQLLAKNDGLSLADFANWFKIPHKEFNGGIIHFTDFRY